MIEDIVKVIVDRPLGSQHPQYKETYYPINYGFVEGIMAEDEEEQDAYILGVDVPVKGFVGKIIAIIHRYDDVEEKSLKTLFQTDQRRDKKGYNTYQT